MMNMSGFSSRPLPSSPQNAGDDRHEPSDGAASRSATEGAAPAIAAPEGRQLSIRERAFDAAQRLVLSQPFMAVGHLEQNRVADYILQLAERFESWMREQAPTSGACMSGWGAAVDDACMSSFDGSVYAWDGAAIDMRTHDQVVDLPADLAGLVAPRDTVDPAIDADVEVLNHVIALIERSEDRQREQLDATRAALEGKLEALHIRIDNLRPARPSR